MSVDTLLKWRDQFKQGVPPTVAIESKLAALLNKSSKVCLLKIKKNLKKIVKKYGV